MCVIFKKLKQNTHFVVTSELYEMSIFDKLEVLIVIMQYNTTGIFIFMALNAIISCGHTTGFYPGKIVLPRKNFPR